MLLYEKTAQPELRLNIYCFSCDASSILSHCLLGDKQLYCCHINSTERRKVSQGLNTKELKRMVVLISVSYSVPKVHILSLYETV